MLASLLRSDATEYMLIACFSLLILGILFSAIAAVKRGENRKYVEAAPNLMTSFGILGTFVGIVIGLYLFDPTQIDESIKSLLAGLRTAFITSVVGMTATIYFKWWDSRRIVLTNPAVSPEEIGPKDIFNILKKQQEATSLLLRAVGGTEENSLVGQIKLMRTDLSDHQNDRKKFQQAFQEKLWLQLSDFSEMLSKSATEQVIDALRQVIIDFNKKLTEQFGDNFKRLDESVKKLVDWQTEYRLQMESMIELYAQGTQSIDATRTAIVEIKDQTGRIPADMQLLGNVLDKNQHQITELGRHLEAFMALRQQAILAIPDIQQKLHEVGAQLKDGADQMNIIIREGAGEFRDGVAATRIVLEKMAHEISTKTDSISTDLTQAMQTVEKNTDRIQTGISQAVDVAMNAVKKNTEASTQAATLAVSETNRAMALSLKQTSQQILGDIQNTQKTMSDSHIQVSKEVKESVDALMSALRKDVVQSLGGVEQQIQEAVRQTGNAVNTQLSAVDKALEVQLNAALNELGRALGSIAAHIGDTYMQHQSPNVLKQ